MKTVGLCLAFAAGVAAVSGQEADVAEQVFSIPATDEFAFAETFQDGLTWTKSGQDKYAGQPVAVEQDKTLPAPFDDERSLLLGQPNKHYGLAKAFSQPVDVASQDKPLVVQYEVKLSEGLTCGGAYIKLLTANADLNLQEMDNDTPYTIMFGPDACGDTSKVHFIFRHQNPVSKDWEEKHLSKAPLPKKDRSSHIYTLVVRPNNSFEILVDGESVSEGSLLEDFTPAVNPPKQIDDPADSKPGDWVDEAKIQDPEATKPDDWNEDAPKQILDEEAVIPSDWLEDEELYIADPSASQPEDWDEEEDGEWEAPQVSNPKCSKVSGCGKWNRPMIDNPAYKGKWAPPMIDNPAYKGVWKPRQIDNPTFFVDEHPHRMAPMGALAVEIWTTNGGIRMDNFVIGHDEAAAKAFSQATFFPKQTAEEQARKDKTKEVILQERQRKKEQGGVKDKLEAYVGDMLDLVSENPLPAIATFIVLLVSLVFLCAPRGDKQNTAEPAAPPATAPSASSSSKGEAADEDAAKDEGDAPAADAASSPKSKEAGHRKSRRAAD